MYLPLIEPVLLKAREVIDLAVAGDLEAARANLDNVRAMRARIARSLQNEKMPFLKYFSDQMGVNLAEDDATDLPLLDQKQLAFYKEQVANLHASLDLIRQWLRSSMEGFSTNELLGSKEGINLYLDNKLPEVWDFSLDIAVLVDSEGLPLAKELAQRGQERFILLMTDHDGNTARELAEWFEEAKLGFEPSLIILKVEEADATESLKLLTSAEIPHIAFIGEEASEEVKLACDRFGHQLSAIFIGSRSIKEWPVVFIEQWLGQIHEMTSFRSVSDLRQHFEGKHLLIASPGPSLLESLPELSRKRDTFIILAPIRSLPALFEAHIVPDFVIQVDATDFEKFLPADKRLNQTDLICVDHSHRSVWRAGFANIFTIPVPHLVGGGLSLALHGPDVPQLPGGSVSVLAAELSAAFGAKSITLVGQDLSTSRGKYAAAADETLIEHQSRPIDNQRSDAPLTCKGINGQTLTTQEDYLWFISEFQQMAQRYEGNIELVNATSFGAYLKGWEHVPLERHPYCSLDSSEETPHQGANFRSFSPDESRARCESIVAALWEEAKSSARAGEICRELEGLCGALVLEGSNDVTGIEILEAELSDIMSATGSLLQFYTSRHTVSLTAALRSVKSLEENLNISADYYHHVAPRAEKLSKLLSEAAENIGSQLQGMGR